MEACFLKFKVSVSGSSGDVRPLRSNGQRCLEASLVSSDSEAEEDGAEIFEWDNSGHSLLAGVHSHSASFFALQGTVDPNWADNLPGQLADMLVSGVGEQAEEAACIVVDTDRFCVQVSHFLLVLHTIYMKIFVFL